MYTDFLEIRHQFVLFDKSFFKHVKTFTNIWKNYFIFETFFKFK